jgi:hypothetical protein
LLRSTFWVQENPRVARTGFFVLSSVFKEQCSQPWAETASGQQSWSRIYTPLFRLQLLRNQ